jgi:hypothetical protein
MKEEGEMGRWGDGERGREGEATNTGEFLALTHYSLLLNS